MTRVRKYKEIIDKKALAKQIDALKDEYSPDNIRGPFLDLLKEAYKAGFDAIEKRCEEGEKGVKLVQAQSFLTDSILKLIYDLTTKYVYHLPNPTKAEQLSLVAIGGYGRGEMAPYSDVDILFLLPYKQTPWGEQAVEYILYMLWDLGLKVGHATRTIVECVRLSKEDLTIRTSLLEARFIEGEEYVFEEFQDAFKKQVVDGKEPEFIEQKLEERDERHLKMGGSRYFVEPNLKDGKGGLRDLQTLYWITKFIFGVQSVSEVVDKGVFSKSEYRQFQKSENFLYTVRCHLHYVAGRPEERITFDVQKTLAERLGYTDRPGSSGVERFMKHYFLTAKNVGDLTRIFCAYLEEAYKRKSFLRLPKFGLSKRKVDGFQVDGARLLLPSAKILTDDPINMIRLFHVAQKHGLDIHPRALLTIRQNLKLVNGKLRRDPEANRLFVEILGFCDKKNNRGPGFILRLMNEVGVMGRFVPDFGRVVAQMQYDMYHVYTVDEHSIRAVELTSEVERGVLAEDHPLANEIIHKAISRNVLYVAVLLHDIAKGRKGDHSILGAEVAQKLCPRLGMSASETEMVAWLVRWHLLMSSTAFKMDLSDPKTIKDFAAAVKSPERLRLLLVLTVVDIRAVGPKIWNGWKGQLLRELYYRAEEVLLGGQIEGGNEHRISHVQEELAAKLPKWSDADRKAYVDRFYESYWLAIDTDMQARNAEVIKQADEGGDKLTIHIHNDDFQDISILTVYTEDHPGLFARLAGAIAISGATIQDARIFTTKDGMALDSFWIQDADDTMFSSDAQRKKLEQAVQDTLSGKVRPSEVLARQRARTSRTDVFTVEPAVFFDNKASNTYTVIEVNGRDRPGFLYKLSQAMFDLSLTIGSAQVATYGERAVNVFFVRDIFGHKVYHEKKQDQIKARLIEVMADKPKRSSSAKKQTTAA